MGTNPTEIVVHVPWPNAGLGCDGACVALAAATQANAVRHLQLRDM